MVVAAALAATGWAVRPLDQPAWEILRQEEPELRLDSLSGALGQGITVALLGGLRAVVADLMFISTSVSWEDSNVRATITGLKLITALDPRPVLFWDQGAQMIAFDMSNWRIDEEGGLRVVSAARQHEIDREQAARALVFLEDGLHYHPDSIMLHLTIARIHQDRLKDLPTAAEHYRKAAELPKPSWFAGRIYARKLIELGRLPEAYDWLVKFYPRLPKAPGEPGHEKMPKNLPPPTGQESNEADAPMVLGIIRDVEKQMGIPPDKAFQP
jgi:tetratricopeptide (TPR) repeat protein